LSEKSLALAEKSSRPARIWHMRAEPVSLLLCQ
jgi:hypothetical protein